MRRHNRLGLAGFAAVTAAVLAAAGCSSSSSSSPTAPASTSAAPASSLPASTGTGGQGAQSVTNYLNYTGGKSGAADTSLPPVYIGYVNQQGGPTAVGLLATAGGLVFAGDREGYFMALDATSGKPLWKFQTGGVVIAPPITYSMNGKQYVAVAAGASLITFTLP